MPARPSPSEAIDEIIAYVGRHKQAATTRRICALVLGCAPAAAVTDEALRELKACLPRTAPVLLETCYNIVKS